MFGTNAEFSELAAARHLRKFRMNIGWPISGMRRLIHYHESSFAGIWERIMREE